MPPEDLREEAQEQIGRVAISGSSVVTKSTTGEGTAADSDNEDND